MDRVKDIEQRIRKDVPARNGWLLGARKDAAAAHRADGAIESGVIEQTKYGTVDTAISIRNERLEKGRSKIENACARCALKALGLCRKTPAELNEELFFADSNKKDRYTRSLKTTAKTRELISCDDAFRGLAALKSEERG
jgi:hypothetical protein